MRDSTSHQDENRETLNKKKIEYNELENPKSIQEQLGNEKSDVHNVYFFLCPYKDLNKIITDQAIIDAHNVLFSTHKSIKYFSWRVLLLIPIVGLGTYFVYKYFLDK